MNTIIFDCSIINLSKNNKRLMKIIEAKNCWYQKFFKTKQMTHIEWTIRKYIGKLFICVGL